MTNLQNLKTKLTPIALAAGLAVTGGTVATIATAVPAAAAVYGQPGCIGDYRWKYKGTNWLGLRTYGETCDYRTSTGAIINDAWTGATYRMW